MPTAVRVAKRVFDLMGAGIGLALVAPLFPLISLLIYIDSPGPVLLRQRRAGRLRGDAKEPGFEEFAMYKFRTMVPDAERHTGPVLSSDGDPRVTRVGHVLRKTRIDELPQLWNVLRGEMSLIGPRPERPERQVNLSMAIPFFEERMRGVKPGITGLAQVSLDYAGRTREDSELRPLEATLVNPFQLDYGEEDGQPAEAEADGMRLKLLYDLIYVASMERFSSFARLDLTIALRTPLVMLRGLGR